MNTLTIYLLHFLYIIIIPVVSYFVDFPIRFRIKKRNILIPVSHRLPFFSKIFPHYNSNLARLAKATKGKYPYLNVIDIGANVGDSAAIIRSKINSPLLCIDGSKKFFDYLKKNSKLIGNINIANYFVGYEGKEVSDFIENKGTGWIMRKTRGLRQAKTRSLKNILKSFPKYIDSKLLKVDTDGYDTEILKSSKEFLFQAKPIIFFEYNPGNISIKGENIVSVFEYLNKLGYDKLMVYDNCGIFMLSVDTKDRKILSELDLYFSSWNIKRYADLCVFHKDDKNLYEEFMKAELAYFQNSIRR